jgi:hypothetical protein
MGAVQRLIGVFTSPSKTFESIAARPGWDWLVPVVLLMIASFVLQSVALPKVDVDQAVKEQMKIVDKMTKGNMPEEARADAERRTREGFEAGKSPVRRALNTLFIVGFILLVPAIYRGIAAAFGRKATYKRLLAGYAYTWMIYLIPIILTIFIVMSRSEVDMNELNMGRMLKSNVAAFLDFESTSKPLLGLLSSIDVFDIWGFVVGSIAVSKMTEFTRKGAYAVVGSVWGVYTLIKVVLGALYGLVG